MYAKAQAIPETVKVQSDNGSLALRFPKRHNLLTAPLKRGGFFIGKVE